MTDELNILIHRAYRDRDTDTAVAVVHVRQRHSPLTEDDARIVVHGREIYDDTATDRLGRKGAWVTKADPDDVRTAVATMRDRYGKDIPVQDNTGILPTT